MDGEKRHSSSDLLFVKYPSMKMAKRRLKLTASGRPSVRFIGESKAIRCLTEQ
jgi:hypothetical protein